MYLNVVPCTCNLVIILKRIRGLILKKEEEMQMDS